MHLSGLPLASLPQPCVQQGTTTGAEEGVMRLFDAGQRGDTPAVMSQRIWTAANVITFVRLAGLPLFVWLMLGPNAYGLAFATLAVVAATDWIDGYVARRFNQVTRLGQLMDPLIDRALLVTASITLALVGFLPLPVLILLVARDVAVVGGGFVLFKGFPPIPVSRTGKFATACLLAGVPGFLLGNMRWPGAETFLAMAWVVTIVGLTAYYIGAAQYVRVALALRKVR